MLLAVTLYWTVTSTVVILYVSHVTSSWTSWTCQQWLQETRCFHGDQLDPIRCGMVIPFQLYGWCCSRAVKQLRNKLEKPVNFFKLKLKQRIDSCKASSFVVKSIRSVCFK